MSSLFFVSLLLSSFSSVFRFVFRVSFKTLKLGEASQNFFSVVLFFYSLSTLLRREERKEERG